MYTRRRFQSTPSAWRVTKTKEESVEPETISIHTLRMEGDLNDGEVPGASLVFQSTPSAWRVTGCVFCAFGAHLISIHTLRMEGDFRGGTYCGDCQISIHTLRMEGDALLQQLY